MEFEEILFRAKNGEDAALQQMLETFHPMLIRNALVNGWFDEELYQELLLETMRCIDNFHLL